MWYYEYLDGNRLCVRPREAWPMSCVYWRHEAPVNTCRSAECIHHMQDKAAEFHKEEARRYKPVLGRRKRRSSDPIWEQKSREWLQEFQGEDDTDMTDGGDALQDYRLSPRSQQRQCLLGLLGNDSGPFEGPE